MGREAKAKHAKEVRVKLPPPDYWELRALIRDIEAIDYDATKAQIRFNALKAETVKRCNDKLDALGKAHNFDPTLNYRWEDKTFELISTNSSNGTGT